MKKPSDLPEEFKGVWLWHCDSCPAKFFTRILPEDIKEFEDRHKKETGHTGTLIVNDRYD